jgi:hypothetical protein
MSPSVHHMPLRMAYRRVIGLIQLTSVHRPIRSPPRALPTETKFGSGMSQSKNGTSVNLRNSGYL